MGKQIWFLTLPEDEKLLLDRAFELGAQLIYGEIRAGHFLTLSTSHDYLPIELGRTVYLWVPSLPLAWFPNTSTVSPSESDAIELIRSMRFSDQELGSGRLWIGGRRLVSVEGRPIFVDHDVRILQLYAELVRVIKKSFKAHKVGTGTVYIGPAALAWHRNGGRLYESGVPIEVSDSTT